MDKHNNLKLTDELEVEFSNFVQLSVSDSPDDLRLYLAKLVRKYRSSRPDFSNRLDQALKSTQTRSLGPSILRRGSDKSVINLPMDSDSRLSLIRVFDDLAGFNGPILPKTLLDEIESIIRERRELKKLTDHGISPTRSAILVGPPGVGKTLTARWIAYKTGKPLWVLDLTAVMSSLLGKTGNNLRMVFDFAKANEAVLLLDEIDAIAKRRSDESDVGELKRLVSAILQEVDAWPNTGLLLAATNHPELVDPALWRRFDAILNFDLPGPEAITEAVNRFLDKDFKQFESFIPRIVSSLAGSSLSEVERTVTSLRRNVILNAEDPAQLVLKLGTLKLEEMNRAEKRRYAIELAQSGELSHSKITELTGVSRDTLRKYAGPSLIKGRALKKEK